MFNRLLSFFVPINIYKKNSALSKALEVTWQNGSLVLDSKNTNYSFGSLQRILRYGLQYIGFPKVRNMKHILVLGVAGGSVIKTLTEEIKYKSKITGVEIDPDVVEIAKEFFKLDKVDNLELVVDDAFEFVLKTREKYDLIIVDVFQDTEMPRFLFQDFFANRLCFLLQREGFILFNTMTLKNEHNVRNAAYHKLFDSSKFKVTALPKVQFHNELFVVEKLS